MEMVKILRACLVAVFENCFGKQFLRTVFKNSFLCFKKKKLCLETELWKTVFILKNKKTCLVELIKKFFKISKTKNMFEIYLF